VRQTSINHLFVVLALALLAGCATKPARDFGGRWKPVNHFDEAPTEIPLYSSYVYQATPMDRTLKAMLTRWAADSNLQLVYQLPSDYTLYGAAAKISTTSIQQASAEVTSAYSAQRVEVSVQGNRILVRPTASSPAAASSP
jgi:type IV pilus biogenesis protein CpaD/CtpE